MDTDILIDLLIQFYIMCTTVQLVSLVYYYIARYQEKRHNNSCHENYKFSALLYNAIFLGELFVVIGYMFIFNIWKI